MDYESVLATLNEIKAKLRSLTKISIDNPIKDGKTLSGDNTFSRVKVVAPTSNKYMQQSENMSPTALDAFTADSIAERYRKQWTKLDSGLKRDRLAAFAKSIKGPADAESFLLSQYFETKKLRPKDIDYDQITGRINQISKLQCDDDGNFKIERKNLLARSAPKSETKVPKSGKSVPTISSLSKKLNVKRHGV